MLIRLSDSARLFHADCRDAIKSLPDNSVDSVVTDPPYALVSIVKRFGKPGSAPAKGNDAYMRASAGFMSCTWDTGETAFSTEFWAEVLRVLKPGGHVAAFGASRGYHRMACAIEDAGFEIRDSLMWIYGTGFPKSHDVSKGIDSRKDWALTERLSGEIKRAREVAGLSLKEIGQSMLAATGGQYGAWYHRGGHMFFETGRALPSRPEWNQLRHVLPISDEFVAVYEAAEREIVGQKTSGIANKDEGARHTIGASSSVVVDITAPATDAARQWEGWGTALKPAFEPIVLARKPLGTGDIDVRRNVEKELRKCGITSEIVWVEESAETANSLRKNTNSPRERQASSVENAIANEVTNTEPTTSKKRVPPLDDGTQTTDRSTSTPPSADTMHSANKSSNIMVENAPAAANANRTSLPSTTSTAAERSTGNLSAARSMPISANEVSPQDSEHFAGIVTGLSDCMERVHIRRENGLFVWPKALPTFVPSKPLTVAANVLRWGTGALNIDGCRVPTAADDDARRVRHTTESLGYGGRGAASDNGGHEKGRWPANVVHSGEPSVVAAFPDSKGQQGDLNATGRSRPTKTCFGDMAAPLPHAARNDSGSAARFFFNTMETDDQWLARNLPRNHASPAENCFNLSSELAASVLRNAADLSTLELEPKRTDSPAPFMNVTPRELRQISDILIETMQSFERKSSLDSLQERLSLSGNHANVAATRKPTGTITITINPSKSDGSVEPVTFNITPTNSVRGVKDCAPSTTRFHYSAKASRADRAGSKHPTVKPIALMEWLATLITPPGGTILDPFAGSGTTGAACEREGFNCILCEREAEYVADIRRRLGGDPLARLLRWNAAVASYRTRSVA